MSNAVRILDLAERAVRAAERIADALDRAPRAQKPGAKLRIIARENVDVSDTDRALARRYVRRHKIAP